MISEIIPINKKRPRDGAGEGRRSERENTRKLVNKRKEQNKAKFKHMHKVKKVARNKRCIKAASKCINPRRKVP